RRRASSCLPDELHESEFARAINGDIEIKLTLGGLHLGNIDVEVADRIGLELLLVGPVALHLWQPRNAMTLQAAVQRRAGQVRDCRLQGIEAIIEGEQRMVSEGDDDRFFLDRQHRRLRILRPGRQIGNRAPLLPLCDGLLVDPIAFGEPPQALLTMLYRSTDRRCRRGAAVKNLSHSASFHSVEKTAPSKPGIKQLVSGVVPGVERQPLKKLEPDATG